MKFIIGFVAGVVVGQVGFYGVVRIMDQGVAQVQKQATDLSQEIKKENQFNQNQ
jgi:hypothetical protein